MSEADHIGSKTVKVSFDGVETGFKINVKLDVVTIILKVFCFGWLWMK